MSCLWGWVWCVYVWGVGADLGCVSDVSGSGGVSPFGQVRLLSVERLRLFTRTAELLGDVSVSAGLVEQTTLPDLCGGEGGLGGGLDLAVVRSLYQVSHGVVVSDLGLALAVVGVLCGGGGGVVGESRPLSRLEMGVFDLVLQPLVDLAVGLFGLDAVELGGHVSSVSGLPSAQVEPVVGLPFHLRVGGIEGVVTLGLSGSQLLSYSEELDRRIAGQLASRADVPSVEIVRAVAPVEVELVAGFELLDVPARELVGLRVGDVLRTGQSVSRPLVARIGSEQLFHVRLACHGQRLVAELTAHVFHNHTSSTIRYPDGGMARPDGLSPSPGVGVVGGGLGL